MYVCVRETKRKRERDNGMQGSGFLSNEEVGLCKSPSLEIPVVHWSGGPSQG